jgi:hypothetical protein
LELIQCHSPDCSTGRLTTVTPTWMSI